MEGDAVAASDLERVLLLESKLTWQQELALRSGPGFWTGLAAWGLRRLTRALLAVAGLNIVLIRGRRRPVLRHSHEFVASLEGAWLFMVYLKLYPASGKRGVHKNSIRYWQFQVIFLTSEH